MITVTLNESNFEYDIYSLLREFYPEDEVKVGVDIKSVPEEKGHIEIQYSADEMQVNIQMKPGISEQYQIDLKDTERIEQKNRLKRVLYDSLTQISGRKLPWGTLSGIRPVKLVLQDLMEGTDPQQAAEHMKERYETSDEKIDLCVSIAEREQRLLEKVLDKNGYSIYINIPFCPSTCLYCSFTSNPIGLWSSRMDEYLDCLEEEMAAMAPLFMEKKLETVYVGGGTPTTLTPDQIHRLLGHLKEYFDCSYLQELTVEAGRPDSITLDKLEALKQEGVTRISINPQTMQQKTLDLIGRFHTVEQTKDAFLMARTAGFDNINMDMIVGLPGETMEDVEDTLKQISDLGPDNLTVHSLAIKRAARLNLMAETYAKYPRVNSPELMQLTADYAKAMGMTPYYLYRQKNMAGNMENVGYALPGKAGIYNVLIMEEQQHILAFGAGASTKLVHQQGELIKRVENVKDVENYLTRTPEMIQRKMDAFQETGILK